uniref:hypothetical protein n=1 Tax=Streptomyces sp. NBC_01001 TaxID=2903713 RepID=UPI002F90D5ED|nr:hypothetical protein OG296_38485 [Streptomyces sp. NBC_01001]
MSTKLRRGSATGKALTLAALLTVAVPGAAYAKTVDVTVATPGATMGPATPFTGVSSHADCADGLVSGGGVDQAIGTDEMANGNHVMGMVPSADGATEYTDTPGIVGSDATHWMAFGGSGSRSSEAFSTTPYAICLRSNLIRHTQVVMNKAPGPSSGLSSKLVTATCPADTVLIGGGARTTPASVGSLKPIASFPTFNDAEHHFGSIAAGDGETDPDSWTAVGGIGGGRGEDNVTYAYAICSRHPQRGFALPEQLLRRLGAVPGRAARAQVVAPELPPRSGLSCARRVRSLRHALDPGLCGWARACGRVGLLCMASRLLRPAVDAAL